MLWWRLSPYALVAETALQCWNLLPPVAPPDVYRRANAECDMGGHRAAFCAVLYCALQVTHRNSVLTAMRGAHGQVSAVRLPDLHAANLFLQVGTAVE